MGISETMIGATTVCKLQPVNPEDSDQMTMLCSWFIDPKISPHLARTPKTPEDVKSYYKTPGVNGFLGIIESGEPVSVGTLLDAGDPEAFVRYTSALLERLCVRPDLQQRRGVGTQTTFLLLEKAFTPRIEGGLVYDKLGLGVIAGPERWEHARNLYLNIGFWPVGLRKREISVGGNMCDVLLMETERSYFNELYRPHREHFFRVKPGVLSSLTQV